MIIESDLKRTLAESFVSDTVCLDISITISAKRAGDLIAI